MAKSNNFMETLSKELHKPLIKKFNRRKVRVAGINDTWACDLVEMQEWSKQNDGYKYMLNVIDVFSRYAWSVKMKNKMAITTLESFKLIVKQAGYTPKKIWVDQGKEFYNSDMKAYRKTHDIDIYSTYAEFKVSHVERFNRTLKNKMWRRFTALNTRRWVDMLPELMKEYNDVDIHSSIKTTPHKAYYNNAAKNQYGKYEKSTKTSTKFSIRDRVRISRDKGKFEKGYLPSWSREIFSITSIIHSTPPTYRLTDDLQQELEGSFYDNEIQKTTIPDIQLVEKVIKTRKSGRKRESYVKWLGLNSNHNSWIMDKDIVGSLNKDRVIASKTGQENSFEKRIINQYGIESKNIVKGNRTRTLDKQPIVKLNESKLIRDRELSDLNAKYANVEFLDDGEQFKIIKVYYKRSKYIVDYSDKDRNINNSLLSEIEDAISKKT
jgi:hypothetical protein